MDLEIAQTTTTAKLPILKQENGNLFKPAAQTITNVDGTSTSLILGPVTTEEKVQNLFLKSGSAGPSNERHPIDTMARDKYNEKTEQSIKIKLITKRAKDGHTYNLPTASEVVGLIVGDVDSCAEQRHIVIEMRKGDLQRINIFHPSYLPIQYPLLVPHSQDGYRLNIPHRYRDEDVRDPRM
ncbi:hypothetical protein Tco_1043797 [Tanacetum coccineum]|uniref:Uncharacterized protein n=1 Tax=Tanacetum coccineum TaxID=301880 RepID=A0ABQ5GN39_9ASTR